MIGLCAIAREGPPCAALPSAPGGSEGHSRITVDEVQGCGSLLRAAPEWNALGEGLASHEFFQSWLWTSTWLEAFQDGDRVVGLVARDGEGRLQGLLPLLPQRGCFLRVPCLHAAANAETPAVGVAHRGDPEPVVRALLGYLGTTRRNLRLILPNVPVDSPFHGALVRSAPAFGLGLAARAARRSLVVEARSGWEEYLASRSKHLRSEWRRKKRRLDASGRVTVIGVSSPEELERFLPCVERVEARSWKGGSGSSLAAGPACRRFYFEMARRAARRGWLRLHLLFLDGQPAAHVLGIAYANELLALKTSYDRSLARFSPGQALMLAVLEASAREGLQAVDLLGFPSRWKTEMANGERAHVDLCLFRRGSIDCVSCAFIQRRVKPFARARLPGIASLANRGLDFLHHRH